MYLNSEGSFTEHGAKNFMDEVAGRISYLNRENDARQFAQPIIKQVKVNVMPRHIQQKVRRGVLKKYKHMTEVMKNGIKENESEIKKGKRATEKVRDMAAHFSKQICNKAYKGKYKTQCNRKVKELTKNIIDEQKEKDGLLKEIIKTDKQQLKEIEAKKVEDVSNAIYATDKTPTSYLMPSSNPGKIMVPNGVLKQLAYKCTSYKSDTTQLMNYFRDHSPEYVIEEQAMEAINKDIDNMTSIYKKEKNKEQKKLIKADISNLLYQRKKTKKKLAKLVKSIKSGFRKQVAKASKTLKKAQRSAKKTIKNIHKKTEYEQAIRDIDENVDKYVNQLGEYHASVEGEIREKEEAAAKKAKDKEDKAKAKEEKAKAKEEKAAEAARVKEEKAKAKEEKAAEAARVKAEKERIKTEKARAKAEAAANKTRKNKKDYR
jgi:hypothetical protein